MESASASAGAGGTNAVVSANDGLSGDSYVQSYPGPDQENGMMATPSGLPGGGHLTKESVSGGVVTFNRSLSASADSDLTFNDSFPDREGASVSYYMSIHAQPYGWYDAGYNPYLTGSSPDTTPGGYADYSNYQLVFRYKWKSTDGDLADLSGIDIYEHVDYTGNPGNFGTDSSGPYYRPTSPPIAPDPNVGDGKQAYELGNPEVSHAMTTTGATIDVHSVWPTQKQYSVLTVTAPQKYEFDDPATGEKGTVLYDVGNIQEGVSLDPDIFYIKKSGAHVEKPLP